MDSHACDSHFCCKRVDNAGDLGSLVGVYAEAFGTPGLPPPGTERLGSLLQDPAVVILAAYAGTRVVGGLTAHVLPSVYSDKSEVYLYDLAVLPGFRRRGIGRALLRELKDRARSLGASEVYVQADAADEDALAFYRATGGAERDVRHFGYGL